MFHAHNWLSLMMQRRAFKTMAFTARITPPPQLLLEQLVGKTAAGIRLLL
jgi:hypothetical protein